MEQQEFLEEMQPSDAAIQAAKQNPGGWVYQIDKEYFESQAVPPEAIAGAWQVNLAGEIVGKFIPNPSYRPKLSRDTSNDEVVEE
ncbi:hypothetical protein [Leptolyngbya sp. GGD]|uniref:hypothetical protein n=1 Tax=Leptolyngbya sp. GGD TaxID=2997907 RepID=UPI00227D4B9F|nr:hypothetical protein [Leptolyngbya sp. GGD]MCY6493926.1 hypothetical protein [Leptolyngbya sp. GGD]